MEGNAEAVSAQLQQPVATIPAPTAVADSDSGSVSGRAPAAAESALSSGPGNDSDNDSDNNSNNTNGRLTAALTTPTTSASASPPPSTSAPTAAPASRPEAGPEPESASIPASGLASPSPASASRGDEAEAASSSASASASASSSATTSTLGRQQRPTSIALPPPFVAPSSYLRFHSNSNSHSGGIMADAPDPNPQSQSPLDKEQRQGLNSIRDFLRKRTSYDVLPLSFRLIVLDTDLLIKKSLNILIQNSIVSAPLWDSHASRFAGILTATDYINVIQYHCQFPDEMNKLDQFRLSSLRDIEKAIGATPIESVSVHPSKPLYEALRRMLKTRARRIPLVDVDDETGRETVISVITQYRILKFIAVNNEHNTILLKKTVRQLHLGTYTDLAVARMATTVLEVIDLMVNRNISCVPVVDSENRVLNAFEAVDVIPCIKGGAYDDLNGTVGEALCKRPEDNPGIFTCSEDDRLDSIFDTIRKSRVHRLIVVDDENKLKGVISLSDILKYVLLHDEEDLAKS
ncbi:nuclear protein SNF4 [Trichoderma sp. SZMC 28014]